jgi:hypothetical protein
MPALHGRMDGYQSHNCCRLTRKLTPRHPFPPARPRRLLNLFPRLCTLHPRAVRARCHLSAFVEPSSRLWSGARSGVLSNPNQRLPRLWLAGRRSIEYLSRRLVKRLEQLTGQRVGQTSLTASRRLPYLTSEKRVRESPLRPTFTTSLFRCSSSTSSGSSPPLETISAARLRAWSLIAHRGSSPSKRTTGRGHRARSPSLMYQSRGTEGTIATG